MKQTADDLRAARALLAKPRGWHRGWFTNGHGGFCAAGAIHMVCSGSASLAKVAGTARAKRAKAALKKIVNEPMLGPWNDAEGRTKRQVLSAFDRAIASEEGR